MKVGTRRCMYLIVATNLFGLLAIYGIIGVVPSSNNALPSGIRYNQGLVILSRKRTDTKPTTTTTVVNVVLPKGACSVRIPPRFTGYTDHWQNVTDRKRHYVFSAHVDGGNVRVIGVTESRQPESLYCQLWSSSYPLNSTRAVVNVSMETVPVMSRRMPEDHGTRYGAVYFICPIPPGSKPYAVSIVAGDPCAIPLNVMAISPPREKKVKFSVCVTPFNFRYSRAYEIVEWIELNRILGAEHFTFYDYSIGPNVRKVLELYSKRGLAEVVSWKLPMGVNKWPPTKDRVEIHYFAQLAALNECLYRNRHNSEFLVFIDLDEFIVPHSANTSSWESMLKSLPQSDVYLFRNSFFRKEWPDDDSAYPGYDIVRKYRLVTLLKLQREEQIWPSEQRSKQMVKPTKVETVGVHNIWNMGKEGAKHTVDPNVAMLHHYRNWERPEDTVKRVPDSSMLKFREDLIKAVNTTWSTLDAVELDLPIV